MFTTYPYKKSERDREGGGRDFLLIHHKHRDITAEKEAKKRTYTQSKFYCVEVPLNISVPVVLYIS
jgi:hypothetical protein